MLADTEEVALSFEQTNIGTGNILSTNRIRFVLKHEEVSLIKSLFSNL